MICNICAPLRWLIQLCSEQNRYDAYGYQFEEKVESLNKDFGEKKSSIQIYFINPQMEINLNFSDVQRWKNLKTE